MKYKSLFAFLCALAFCYPKALAQLPETSTSDDPRWYYIQVKGEGDDRIDRIFTITGNDIHGDYLSNINTEQDRSKRLWRFEKEGDKYYIINKLYNIRKMGIRVASEIEQGLEVATLISDIPETWELIEYNGYYQIKSSTGMYAHQANNHADVRNYVVMFVDGSKWHTSDNSLFSFLPYDKNLPKISDSTTDYWYYIRSGAPEYQNKCITDITENSSNKINFKLEDLVVNNKHQQWKAIQPINDATDGTMYFVNRATDNIIQTAYEYSDNYYYARSTDNIEESNGWKIEYIDFNQFSISGLTEERMTGYLNLSSTTKEPEALPASYKLLNTVYTWTFKRELNPGGTSIDNEKIKDPFENITIYTANRKIVVEGTDEYTITNLSGIRQDKKNALPTGVYLITIKGKSVAYLVK